MLEFVGPFGHLVREKSHAHLSKGGPTFRTVRRPIPDKLYEATEGRIRPVEPTSGAVTEVLT